MSFRNRKALNGSTVGDGDDFYSALAAEAEDDQGSDVSDADVAALTKALSDMDDMDDALFASSLRNRKSSTLKSEKPEDTQRKGEKGKELIGTRTLTPPSLSNTADSKRRTFTIKEESPPDNERKSSLKKPASKSFDFGEFDEDDPLAGLLSDEEEDPKPVKKPAVQQPPSAPSKVERKSGDDNIDFDFSPRESPGSLRRSTSLSRRGPDMDMEEPEPSTRAKSAPPPKRSEPLKKSDDVDFDDDDILDTMGFDDSPPQKKRSSEPRIEDDEIRAAKSKVADLFGQKSKSSLQEKEKPPAGRTKDFVLDPKYKKHERAKPQKDLDEEDFSFGSYTPSAVNTLKRPDSAPPGRRSVRFADEEEDLFGGTSTLDRPARGAGRPRSNSQAVGASNGVKGQTVEDDDGDWLSLAVGKKKDPNQSQKMDEVIPKQDDAPKKDVSQEKKDKLVTSKDGVEDAARDDRREEIPQENENPRAASAGDYLGLGEDIDLDSLLSSKPASRLGHSRRRDTRSSFPWDDGEMDTTAGLGSTMDSKLFGDTMSAEEDGHEDTQSSGLISRQVAELAKLEEEEEARKRTTANPPSTQWKDQPLLSGETQQDDKDEDRPSLSSLPHPSGGGGQPTTNMDPPTSTNPRPAIKSESPMGTADPQRGRPLSSTGPMPASTEQPADGDINNIPNSTLPMRRNQSGVRKEPQWRQELRMRQEQMQGGGQSSSSSHHPEAESSSVPTSQPVVISNSDAPSEIPQEPPSIPTSSFSSSVHGGEQLVQPSVNLWQEQMKQQQQQAQDFEQAIREQKSRLKAQQEEQLRQMQKMQQEAMQQQLQMQQQMMQTQTLAPPPPSMMSFNSQPFQMPYRNPQFESKLQQLEDEKRYLETSLKSLQDQHKQQLAAKDAAQQDYVHLIEESMKKKEERLRQEQEDQKRRFEDRLEEMVSERMRMTTEHHQRMQELQTDYQQQREIINRGHKQELDAVTQKHQKDLEQVRHSMQEELEAMSKATDHSRSLQAVMSQVGVVGQELGSLQTRMSSEHQQQLDRQRSELTEKDQQLKDLQKSLEHQQDEMIAERSRLESMIQRLETQIRQQSTQLDEERWRLRQEQTKLSSFQRALEEERKIAAEQTALQQVALQQTRESLSLEQQSNVSHNLDERKVLATERAQITRERKELEASIKRHAERMSKENAEREGRLQALMEDEKKTALALENLERQKKDQMKQQQILETEKNELMREQDKLHSVAEKLRIRAQQIEEAVQDAVQVKQEGLSNLEQARKIESEQMQREQGIQEQLQSLRAMERQIARERLKQAEDERRFDELMSEGLCPNCQRGPNNMKSSGEAFLLPIAGGYPGDKYRVPNPTSYPSIQQAVAHISSKDELVDHVLNKAEFNHTVSVWRLAADKDKDFLEEETSFLNGLMSYPSSFSQP
ncbi:uncharacterized protein [Apostichopus japonicus]|uniref:uncharacterized protein isoform X2 n=1 Tax=Stichopus japonicus TaxID=307972 RepID=UPI003AB18C21